MDDVFQETCLRALQLQPHGVPLGADVEVKNEGTKAIEGSIGPSGA